jgi:MEMO1 family protein
MKLSGLLAIILLFFNSCSHHVQNDIKIRNIVDKMGFAHEAWQADSVVARIMFHQHVILDSINDVRTDTSPNIACICPHDDHSYVGYNYLATLKNITANTLIMIGVAHKARVYGLENQLVFEDFDYWNGPNGLVKISNYRDSLLKYLPANDYIVHDSMHIIEHSLEGIIPFLQAKNENIQIIPILVPYASYNTMDSLSHNFSEVLSRLLVQNNLTLGEDIAIVISSDAVHYGDEEWGGKNFARFGADSAGYLEALEFEKEIINSCLVGEITKEKIKKFTYYTVQDDDYKEYKWTWCGRYSIPFGISVLHYLNEIQKLNIEGYFLNYATSISQKPLPVKDLNLGQTAPANIRHWVGYANIIYY